MATKKKTEKVEKKPEKAPAKPTTAKTKTTTTRMPSKKSKAAKPAGVKKAPSKAKSAAQTPKQTVSSKARHPKARVLEVHGGKEALAKALAPSVARSDEDTDQVEARLKTASNAQLLRLSRVNDQVKQKWGNREKLIAWIGNADKKANDKDFLAKLGTFSLPQLVDMALSAERRARA
jgi:hypothetical protein